MSATLAKDRRIERTRLLLRQSLMALAESREISTISVQEITDRANVGRATFYLHYRNKEELLADVVEVLFDEIRTETISSSQLFSDALLSDDGLPGGHVVQDLLKLLERRKPLYRTLFGTPAGSYFADRFQSLYEEALTTSWNRLGRSATEGTPPAAFRLRYAAGGARAILLLWIEQDDASFGEQFSEWSRSFAMYFLTHQTVETEHSQALVHRHG